MHTASPAGYGKIALHFDPHLGCGEAVVFPMRTDRAIIKGSDAGLLPCKITGDLRHKLGSKQIDGRRQELLGLRYANRIHLPIKRQWSRVYHH